MSRLLFFIFSAVLITNISAEELTDIQISSPVMDKATISNEAIEEMLGHRFYGAIPIHDRFDTWEAYDYLSR